MASPAPTPPPRAPARRAPRGLLLPRERSRRWPSALVALLVHAGIIALLLWHHRWIEPGGGGLGVRGGGGGGGAGVHYIALAPPAADAPARPPTVAPAVTRVVPPVERAVLRARVAVAPAVVQPAALVNPGAGTGTGPGSGSGTGGGQGGGVGPGVGNDSGPGTGGAAPVPFPPRQRLTTASLPECVWQSRARRVTITFWVDSTGRVERSEIDPRPRDASCARDYIDAMTRAGFEPARAANGARIAGTATVTYSR